MTTKFKFLLQISLFVVLGPTLSASTFAADSVAIQDVQQTPSIAKPILKVKPGLYHGSVDGSPGNYAFDLSFESGGDQSDARAIFYKGPEVCKVQTKFSVVYVAEKTIKLQPSGFVLKGCERNLELTFVNEDTLKGKLTGPWGDFNVTVVKQ